MSILIVILLMCVISLLIPVIYFTSQGVPLEDVPEKAQEAVQEYLPESMQDAAYKREMENIRNESGESAVELQKKRQDASKKRAEASQAEAEAARAAQVFTEPEATQEEKDAAAAKLAEAAAAAEAARQAEAEAAAEAQRNREAQAQAQRDAQALATLKEGCKNVTWENVYVGGRPGADLAFWNKTSITTGGTTITKGNKKITTERPYPKKTTVQENQITGRDSRGRPTYSWRNKVSYDGYIGIKGKEVGWVAMNKMPSSRQPSSCKDSRPVKRNCAYEPGDFNKLHTFSDSSLKFVIVNNHMGVMQAQTGKFYSIPDKKVMDNPLTSDCKTKLDYK